MANVLSEDKQQQVIALGRLGWSLRRIERETGIRRETAAVYLRAAGVAVGPPGWGRKPSAKPAIQVATDFALTCAPPTEMDLECAIRPRRSPRASACEPYRELIELALVRGRNAMAIWQDL